MWSNKKEKKIAAAAEKNKLESKQFDTLDSLLTQITRKRVHENDGNSEAKAPKRPREEENGGKQKLNRALEVTKFGGGITAEELSQFLHEDMTDEEKRRREVPHPEDFKNITYDDSNPYWLPANPTEFKTEDILTSQVKRTLEPQASFEWASNSLVDTTSEGQRSGVKAFVKAFKPAKPKNDVLILTRKSVKEINEIMEQNRRLASSMP